MITRKLSHRELRNVEVAQLLDDLGNHMAVAKWVTHNGGVVEIPGLDPCLFVRTPKGLEQADIGDWIVRDDEGRFHVFGPAFEDELAPRPASAGEETKADG